MQGGVMEHEARLPGDERKCSVSQSHMTQCDEEI